VLSVGAKGAAFALPVTGDHLGVIGDNGKILIFPLDELPEMVAWQGREAAGVPRGRLARRRCLQSRRRGHLDRYRGPYKGLDRVEGLVGSSGVCRQDFAEGLPYKQEVQAKAGQLGVLPIAR